MVLIDKVIQHSTPDLNEITKEQEDFVQLRDRAERAALKTAKKRNSDGLFFIKLPQLVIKTDSKGKNFVNWNSGELKWSNE